MDDAGIASVSAVVVLDTVVVFDPSVTVGGCVMVVLSCVQQLPVVVVVVAVVVEDGTTTGSIGDDSLFGIDNGVPMMLLLLPRVPLSMSTSLLLSCDVATTGCIIVMTTITSLGAVLYLDSCPIITDMVVSYRY
jgi:hypothetical protein